MFMSHSYSHSAPICLATVAVLLFSFVGLGNQVKKSRSAARAQRPAAQTPQQILALGLYYFNNDDISGNAEKTLKQLLDKKYQGTNEAESAQYYLACYYQRKFYLQRAKRRIDEWNTLKQAAAEFRNYTDNYYSKGRSVWLSDSFFNLAMVYLQLGEPWNANNELSKIRAASARDPNIYLYQIVWSSQSQDVIDSNLPASRLADYAISVVKSNPYYFEKSASMIKQWCQGQKASKS